jgi:hypothetical protein
MIALNISQALIDYTAITDVLNRYTEGANRRDWGDVIATFSHDGIWEAVGPDGGSARFTGHTELMRGLSGLASRMDIMLQTSHVTTVRVDANQAFATSMLEEWAKVGGEDVTHHYLGMYYDDLGKNEKGHWRFKKRYFRTLYFENIRPDGSILAKYPLRISSEG